MRFKSVFTLVTIIFTFFNTMLSMASAPAQTPEPALEDLLPGQCNFSGSFIQVRKVESIPAPLESRGDFLFSCDHGLIWHTESPTSETLIYTNNKKHFYVDGDGQVNPLKGRVHASMALLLNGLMGADTNYLHKYFTVDSITAHNVQLEPKKKNMQKFIRQLSLHRSGDTVEINLLNDADNSTQINIFNTNSLDKVSAAECARHYPEPICDSLLNDKHG